MQSTPADVGCCVCYRMSNWKRVVLFHLFPTFMSPFSRIPHIILSPQSCTASTENKNKSDTEPFWSMGLQHENYRCLFDTEKICPAELAKESHSPFRPSKLFHGRCTAVWQRHQDFQFFFSKMGVNSSVLLTKKWLIDNWLKYFSPINKLWDKQVRILQSTWHAVTHIYGTSFVPDTSQLCHLILTMNFKKNIS